MAGATVTQALPARASGLTDVAQILGSILPSLLGKTETETSTTSTPAAGALAQLTALLTGRAGADATPAIMAAAMQGLRDTGLPQVFNQQQQSGGYNNPTTLLLGNDLASRIATQAAAQGVQANTANAQVAVQAANAEANATKTVAGSKTVKPPIDPMISSLIGIGMLGLSAKDWLKKSGLFGDSTDVTSSNVALEPTKAIAGDTFSPFGEDPSVLPALQGGFDTNGAMSALQEGFSSGSTITSSGLSQVASASSLADISSGLSGISSAVDTAQVIDGADTVLTAADVAGEAGTGGLGYVANVAGAALGSMFGNGDAGSVSDAVFAPVATADTVFNSVSNVICTELKRQGKIPAGLWYTDFSNSHGVSDVVTRGYHLWGRPYVRLMQRSPLATALVTPVVISRLSYLKTRSPRHLLGLLTVVIGEPICWCLGVLISPCRQKVPA